MLTLESRKHTGTADTGGVFGVSIMEGMGDVEGVSTCVPTWTLPFDGIVLDGRTTVNVEVAVNLLTSGPSQACLELRWKK